MAISKAQLAKFNQNLLNVNKAANSPLPNNGAITPAAPDGVNYGVPTTGTYDYGGSTGGTSTGGGSTATNAISPDQSALYDQAQNQAQFQIDQLGQQQQVGEGNINNAYTSALNTLLGAHNQAQQNYDQNKAGTVKDYTTANGNVQQQVGQQSNSLQRLLGAHGYQGSANGAANYAAALQGTQQQRGLQDTYAKNNQALDQGFGDYNNQFNSSRDSLDTQKKNNLNNLQSQIDTNKSSLLSQLAQIAQARTNSASSAQPYLDQINALAPQITQLGAQYQNPGFNAPAPTYKAPDLGSYQLGPQAGPQVNSAAAGAISPYFATLLNSQQEKQRQGLGV